MTTTTMTREELVRALWQEQINRGVVPRDEIVDDTLIADWIDNRNYCTDGSDDDILNLAAAGDVAALAQVRIEAGLPVF